MIPNNACHLRITAAAGTKLAVTSSGLDQSAETDFLPPDSSLHPEGLPPTRGVAGSVSYTHPDAADDLLCVDLGGRRIIKKKTNTQRGITSKQKINK